MVVWYFYCKDLVRLKECKSQPIMKCTKHQHFKTYINTFVPSTWNTLQYDIFFINLTTYRFFLLFSFVKFYKYILINPPPL